jgi:peptidoglycan/LPS O-acetylase OafA/YrhL
MKTSYTPPKLNFDILDSLRGMAALYVCIGHSRGLLWIGGTEYLKQHPRETLGIGEYIMLGLNMLTRLSTEFVIVFFVLSGFSIAHSLRKRTDPISFYKRRLVRLYPPYLAALAWGMGCFWLINALAPSFTNGSYATPVFDRLRDSHILFEPATIVKNLFYYPQLDGILRPFWSLTQEVLFYLIAPWLFRSLRLYYAVSVALFLFATLGFGVRGFHPNLLLTFCFYNIFFTIGVWLYHNFSVLSEAAQKLKGYWLPLACLGLFGAMIPLSLLNQEAPNSFLAALMSSLLIIHLLNRQVEIGWLMKVGRFSYTLYITHFPTIFLFLTIYFLAGGATPPSIENNFVFIPAVLLCLGVAYLHYLAVEKRTKSWLESMRRSQTKIPAQGRERRLLAESEKV